MATTPNYSLTLLEVGQKEKEITINTNFTSLDTALKTVSDVAYAAPVYLGDLASDPATPTQPLGSTYFNTGTSKLKVLRQKTPSVIWTNVA